MTTAEQFTADLNALILDIRARAMSQFAYNLATNVPKGTVSLADAASHAVDLAATAALAARARWDVYKAGALAVSLLEEVNAHPEAAALHTALEAR